MGFNGSLMGSNCGLMGSMGFMVTNGIDLWDLWDSQWILMTAGIHSLGFHGINLGIYPWHLMGFIELRCGEAMLGSPKRKSSEDAGISISNCSSHDSMKIPCRDMLQLRDSWQQRLLHMANIHQQSISCWCEKKAPIQQLSMNTWGKPKHIENHQLVFDPQDFEAAKTHRARFPAAFGDPKYIASAANHT